MPAVLDHLVLAVPDLDAAVHDLAARTGVVPVDGGAHPGRGTRNALVGLVHRGRARCYLELLGPDPAQPAVPPEDTMLGLGRLGPRFGPRLHAWAVRPDDLDATLRAASAAGLDAGEAVAASRTTPSGQRLSWRLAVPQPLGLDGVQPFLIDWGGGPHPADADLPVLELRGLEVRHPDPAAAARALAVLGADVPVARAGRPGLRALMGTPLGPVELV